ncbi:hypothetical protein M231_00921 [Tremella mesenterica]|uniref:Uncharacterized protein n=1 Tax=Tremella mesenterica TaxID=5217 RepID=A0A4Q1BUF8_TREME|nr:hypothetical protein M231_00921 [Tremella mesenterica]
MSQVRRAPVPQTNLPGFPMMTTGEIMDCLAALGINVAQEDITKPTWNSAQMIYSSLLDALMGVPPDALDQPKAALLGMMEYKELYADALQFTMLFRHCRALASLCGISNFNMSDLTRPDAQRLRTALSGIMNFAKFRDERSQFHLALVAKVAKQSDKAQQLRKKLEQIDINMGEITARHAADRPLTDKAKERNDSLRSELMGLRTEQVNLSHEVEDLKRERGALSEQATNKMHELATLTSQTTLARSRLVQSPERIKRNISEMTHQVTVEKATLSTYQQQARSHQNRLEVFGGLERDLKELIDLEKTIEQQKIKVEEARRSQSALQARLEGKNIEGQGLKSKLEQLDRQLQFASDKLHRQQELGRETRDRAKKRIDDVKAEYVKLKKVKSVWQREKDNLMSQIKELEDEMGAFISKNEREIDDLLQDYWTTRKQAEDYMNTMTVKLGLVIG